VIFWIKVEAATVSGNWDKVKRLLSGAQSDSGEESAPMLTRDCGDGWFYTKVTSSNVSRLVDALGAGGIESYLVPSSENTSMVGTVRVSREDLFTPLSDDLLKRLGLLEASNV
jgi:hypothetical protein